MPTAAQADQLIAIAKEHNKLLCVYQNRRWDNDFRTVQQLVSAGTLGRIVEFNTHFERYKPGNPTNWKAGMTIAQGGSALYDLGTHLVDQAYTLFGMPKSVHGRCLSQRTGSFDFENPDGVTAELTYPDGLLVHVRISIMSAEVTQPRFWVRGTKGSFQKWGLDTQEEQLQHGWKAADAGFGQDDPKNLKLTLVGEDGVPKAADAPILEPVTYKAFYAELAKAVESGKDEDVPVKATQARDVLLLLEGILESAKTGKDVSFA